MTSLEKRIAILETEVFKLKKKSIGSVHAGKKSKEVIAQEIKSLFNSYKPETSTKSETDEFLKEFSKSASDVSALPEHDQKWIKKQVKEFQTQIEEIQNRDN